MYLSLKSYLKSLFFFFILGLGSAAWSQEWKQKTEKKSLQRWTLQEWLQQKERNKLMDQWLLLHTPSPYEFALEVTSINYVITSLTPSVHHKTITGSFTAYATLVGLEVQTNNNFSEGFIDNTGLFHMRFLGASDQSSHLTLSLGQKNRLYHDETLPMRTQYFGQIDLTLYFNSHFGFQLLHRGYYPIREHHQWGDLNGYSQSAHIFIDFAALRIFGGLSTEKETQTVAGIKTDRALQDTHMGLRLYF